MNEPASTIEGDPRWELTQRVAGSHIFARSPSLRRFLLFVCESALHGQIADLKEQQIGHKVLGRPADYNASEDNIVRVRARELRRKLEEYFKSEGKDERTVILLPKGGYVPIFQPRGAESPAATPARQRLNQLPWAISALLAVVCAVLLVLSMRRPAPFEAPRPPNSVERLWKLLIRPGEQTLVVAADSNFVILQDLTNQSVPLDGYIRQKFLARPEFRDSAMASIASRQYTGIGEVHVLLRILRINPDFARRIRLGFARDLAVHDLKTGNAVLMGASRSNPWVELFEPRCRFVFRWGLERKQPYILDRNPKPGEPSMFETQVNGNSAVSYATISFLPNLAGTGNVLIISGLNTVGTEAAGEFVTVPEACDKLLQKAGFGPSDPILPFEANLRLHSVGGGSSSSEIVAVRRFDRTM